jgi:hypothetical protein
MTHIMAIDMAPNNVPSLTPLRDAELGACEATGWLRPLVLFPIMLSHWLYPSTVPLPVGVYGVVAGKEGVNVAVTSKGLPFASVVVYVNGVGPPGVVGVVPGWPTGPCWACVVVAVATAVVVGDVAAVDAAAVVRVGEVWAVVVVAAPPKVCLESTRRKKRTRRRNARLQYLCYSLAKGISGDLLDYGVACP